MRPSAPYFFYLSNVRPFHLPMGKLCSLMGYIKLHCALIVLHMLVILQFVEHWFLPKTAELVLWITLSGMVSIFGFLYIV